jgi:hypothetical protein
VLVAVVVKLLVLKGSAPVTAPPPVVHHPLVRPGAAAAAAKSHATPTAPRHRAAPAIDPTLPAPLRTALARHAVVVAVLYAPGVPGDGAALDAARAGAKGAHAGFAVLNVRNESVAAAMATKLPGSSDPSVLVVRRPGKIALVINGFVDDAVVSQAARTAA